MSKNLNIEYPLERKNCFKGIFMRKIANYKFSSISNTNGFVKEVEE